MEVAAVSDARASRSTGEPVVAVRGRGETFAFLGPNGGR
jgi:hypothetical protein